MTHDELVKKILIKVEAEMFSDTYDGYATGDSSLSRALLKVVELHKPMNICRNLCSGCYEEEGGPNPYPCPTIQAIEKELG